MSFLDDTLTLYKREMLIFTSRLRTNVIRSIMFPLILILLLGNIGNSFQHVPITVVNYANNPAATSFISALQAQNTLSIIDVAPQDVALADVANNNAVLAVVILPGFPGHPGAPPAIDLYYSNTQVTESETALQAVESVASSYGASINGDPPSAVSPSQPSSTFSLLPLAGATSTYKTFLIGGIIIMVAAFGAMFGGGMSIITDRSLGNLKAFLITPINKNAIVLSKILSGTTQSIFSGFLALGIGLLAGAGVAMGIVGLAWIVLIVLLLSLGFSAMTVAIASRTSRPEIYAIFAQTITLPLWFLSGAFFPTSSLPSWIYPLSVVNPLTYAANGVRDVMMAGVYPLASAALDLSIVVAFSLVMIIIAFRTFKRTI